jgi:DNA-binding Lrp family transcriptional regulator
MADAERLDDTDARVLALLAENPRRTLKELSEAIRGDGDGISHEAVRLRIQRLLERAHMLPLLDWKRYELDLVVVTVRTQGGAAAARTARKVCAEQGAILTQAQFGDGDVQAWFLVHSQAHLARVLEALRNAKGVREVGFAVVLDQAMEPANLAASARRRAAEGLP